MLSKSSKWELSFVHYIYQGLSVLIFHKFSICRLTVIFLNSPCPIMGTYTLFIFSEVHPTVSTFKNCNKNLQFTVYTLFKTSNVDRVYFSLRVHRHASAQHLTVN